MTDLLDPLVILTGVLAVVTGFYAYTTILLVRETRASRESQQEQYKLDNEPRIAIGTQWYGLNLFTYIVNVGSTPALNISVTASIKLKENSSLQAIGPGKVASKLLMPGEKVQFNIPDSIFGTIKTDFHSLALSGTCNDAHGKPHPINEEWVFDIPDAATSQRNIWQVLPDDEPLIQIKKTIAQVGGEIKDSIKEVGDKIEAIGPERKGYCSICKQIHYININEQEIKCKDCGNQLKLF